MRILQATGYPEAKLAPVVSVPEIRTNCRYSAGADGGTRGSVSDQLHRPPASTGEMAVGPARAAAQDQQADDPVQHQQRPSSGP
jgi:hypothetical protein